MWEGWEVWEVKEGWEGCGRGGSEEERMDEILLVIGKKEGRVRERVKKLGKWGVGRGGRSCNISSKIAILGQEGRSK